MSASMQIAPPERVFLTGASGFIGRALPKGLAISLAEAGAGIARRLGRQTELGRGAVELLGRPATYSIEKARRLLGYSPAIDLDEGMRRSETWARQEGLCGSKP